MQLTNSGPSNGADDADQPDRGHVSSTTASSTFLLNNVRASYQTDCNSGHPTLFWHGDRFPNGNVSRRGMRRKEQVHGAGRGGGRKDHTPFATYQQEKKQQGQGRGAGGFLPQGPPGFIPQAPHGGNNQPATPLLNRKAVCK